MKFCPKCNLFKDESLFTTRKRNKDGLDTYCKECNDIYRKEYHSKRENKDRRNKSLLSYRRDNPKKSLLALAKKRAKENNLDFFISEADFTIPEFCPIFGIPIFVSNEYRSDNSISIDRIDNTKGYLPNNIIIVSWRANRIKANASLQEMGKIIFYLQQPNTNLYEMHPALNNSHYIKEMIRGAKKRAHKNNLDFSLSIEDVIIPLYCPVLGLSLEKGSKKFCHNSPSIDRIDNNLGYIPSNIRIISHRANNLKNNASKEEYITLYNFYRDLEKSPQPLKGRL